MATKETNPVKGFFMLGLMLGAAVGAAIGLLYAPQPGSASRQELADWAEEQATRARVPAGGDGSPADGGAEAGQPDAAVGSIL